MFQQRRDMISYVTFFLQEIAVEREEIAFRPSVNVRSFLSVAVCLCMSALIILNDVEAAKKMAAKNESRSCKLLLIYLVCML
jgi:hypothetical protein